MANNNHHRAPYLLERLFWDLLCIRIGHTFRRRKRLCLASYKTSPESPITSFSNTSCSCVCLFPTKLQSTVIVRFSNRSPGSSYNAEQYLQAVNTKSPIENETNTLPISQEGANNTHLHLSVLIQLLQEYWYSLASSAFVLESKGSFNSPVEGLFLTEYKEETTDWPSALYCRLLDVLRFDIADDASCRIFS